MQQPYFFGYVRLVKRSLNVHGAPSLGVLRFSSPFHHVASLFKRRDENLYNNKLKYHTPLRKWLLPRIILLHLDSVRLPLKHKHWSWIACPLASNGSRVYFAISHYSRFHENIRNIFSPRVLFKRKNCLTNIFLSFSITFTQYSLHTRCIDTWIHLSFKTRTKIPFKYPFPSNYTFILLGKKIRIIFVCTRKNTEKIIR